MVTELKGALLSLTQFLAAESPLKMMTNAFYFAFSFSRYLNFCLDFFVIQKNGLIRNISLISKINDVTTWATNNCNTHIDQYLKK